MGLCPISLFFYHSLKTISHSACLYCLSYACPPIWRVYNCKIEKFIGIFFHNVHAIAVNKFTCQFSPPPFSRACLNIYLIYTKIIYHEKLMNKSGIFPKSRPAIVVLFFSKYPDFFAPGVYFISFYPKSRHISAIFHDISDIRVVNLVY